MADGIYADGGIMGGATVRIKYQPNNLIFPGEAYIGLSRDVVFLDAQLELYTLTVETIVG